MNEIMNPKTKDTFNLTELRLSNADLGKVDIQVKQRITTVPVRKPNKQDFVRTHGEQNAYWFSCFAIELKEEREFFIVHPSLQGELIGESIPMQFITTINRQNVLSLWPVKLPLDGSRGETWNISALDAAATAQKEWVRVVANMSLGAYEIFVAQGQLKDPVWPELSMDEIMSIAFRDKVVSSLEHPVVLKLRGQQ